MSFDFNSTKAKTKDTSTLKVKHPNEGEIGVEIVVAGRDSEIYQTESAKYRKELINMSARRNGEPDSSRGNDILARFLAAITVSWKGVVYDGENLECTEENAFKLYSDRSLTWLRDQVDDFAVDRRNYLGN